MSNCGAPARIFAITSGLNDWLSVLVSILETSMSPLNEDMSMPDRSRLTSVLLESALVSKLNAFFKAFSSMENIDCMSKPLSWSSCSSSNDLPVNTSVSLLASCCFTMSEPAAASMR